ncbi:hypothetical protein HanRHA438_Chr12g0549541 [Helianthus annuus]|nr:hypothetical protein HanRHA438_Chr12g0549541 [Helianthus annuus]
MIITRFHVQNDIVFVGCPSVPISEGRSEPLKVHHIIVFIPFSLKIVKFGIFIFNYCDKEGIQIFKISLSYQKD